MSVHRYSTKAGDRWRYVIRPEPGGKQIAKGGFLSSGAAQVAEAEYRQTLDGTKEPNQDTLGELTLSEIALLRKEVAELRNLVKDRLYGIEKALGVRGGSSIT
ncbi:hypothetical protein QLQ12_26860 [Actinoplanes sp. NEAU-A12]|uniref:Integrase n=1 Tax=Actinoplanes sandaracinus TaxID=3045177 RepID=A0ABT6WR99_9ACTN|nr:hypothetical protein [Actinoplanes sandaracinus]MDI6102244.1 hypothetical protein [Actinoplanes sandaracinus]